MITRYRRAERLYGRIRRQHFWTGVREGVILALALAAILLLAGLAGSLDQ